MLHVTHMKQEKNMKKPGKIKIKKLCVTSNTVNNTCNTNTIQYVIKIKVDISHCVTSNTTENT